MQHSQGVDADISVRLNKLLGTVIISQGGVVPFINPELLPSKTKKKVRSRALPSARPSLTIPLLNRVLSLRKFELLVVLCLLCLFPVLLLPLSLLCTCYQKY